MPFVIDPVVLVLVKMDFSDLTAVNVGFICAMKVIVRIRYIC